MNIKAAKKLTAKLETEEGVPEHVVAMVNDEGTEIVFCSELTGTHTLSLADSDRARVIAHWKGFLANQPKEDTGAKKLFAIECGYRGNTMRLVSAPDLSTALMLVFGTTRLNYAALTWREVELPSCDDVEDSYEDSWSPALEPI